MATRNRTTQKPPRESWDLAENATLKLPRRRVAVVVRAERGTVLVTRGGDREDHVLEPGDELVLPRGGLAVAWAFTAATISVREGLRVLARGADEAPQRAGELEPLGVEVAHELKNPLAGVKALVQLGLRNPAEAPAHERLVFIEREVARMQEILRRFLSSARPREDARPPRVALGPVVADALLALSALAGEARVRLRARGEATVDGDPRRLKEALLNLVANAIEATPPGGEVVVEVRQTGDAAEIAVRDTGRGMSSETLARLGTPFFTTREDGTGLGVVLARAVIADHGGSLQYESEPGRGTTVRAILPGRVAPDASATALPQSA
ncbi:ATP-binding protein [Anaeromyxobacter terrae]|uniref:ATP-binding protein n=1 Tax=Anaeromyxobacter terrae TaxID=2925406 RepID=UPI001F56C532|nr:ATP-binding protein [Anaeromyxobacter sp. SG22]